MGFKPQPMYEKLRALQRGETSSRGTAPLRSARSAYNTGRTPNLGSLPSPFRRSYCPKKRVGKAHQIHVMWCSSGRCGGGETGPKGRRALASRKQFSSSFWGGVGPKFHEKLFPAHPQLEGARSVRAPACVEHDFLAILSNHTRAFPCSSPKAFSRPSRLEGHPSLVGLGQVTERCQSQKKPAHSIWEIPPEDPGAKSVARRGSSRMGGFAGILRLDKRSTAVPFELAEFLFAPRFAPLPRPVRLPPRRAFSQKERCGKPSCSPTAPQSLGKGAGTGAQTHWPSFGKGLRNSKPFRFPVFLP